MPTCTHCNGKGTVHKFASCSSCHGSGKSMFTPMGHPFNCSCSSCICSSCRGSKQYFHYTKCDWCIAGQTA